MWNRIKWWLVKRKRSRCNHNWIQGAEYWHNKTGENYDYLLPEPMKYHPGYQANCYICDKCGKTITTIEKIDTGEKIGVVK